MAHRRGGFQKKIDTVHWTVGAISVLAGGAGSFARTVLAAQHLPETLLRSRGELVTWLDAAQAPGTIVQVTCGMILVPEGTGTTVLWEPSGDGDAPWIWWDTYLLAYEEMVIDTIQVPALSGVRRVIDSKAMRKVRNTELQFVATNFTVGVASSVNVVAEVRVLAGS